MKCYYEVLDVSRDADDSEIKSAYRKLALRWHPDKNLDNSDYAKEQFQIVQQAYEVLSDRHERCWYDNHREQILRGSNSEYEDKSLDLFQFFTTGCFTGYGDDDQGFYAIYRNVFENIAKEEMEFVEEKEEFFNIPNFGNSQISFEQLSEFYGYWLHYSTKKSYVWLDPFDIRETRNRRYVKMVEKENKKIRQKAKKERNEEVRNLVSFVRKRDKRVQAHKKIQEQKLLEDKIKRESLIKQKRLERQQELSDTSVVPEWAQFENVKCELEEVEKNLVEQFGEEFIESENEHQDDFNSLYCVACNKTFKTSNAFENHEFSKKHRDNVELLKESMLNEDDDFEGGTISDSTQGYVEDLDSNGYLDGLLEESIDENDIESEIDSIEEINQTKPKRKIKKSRNILVPTEDAQLIDESISIHQESNEEDSKFEKCKNQKKKNKKKQKSNQTTENTESEKLEVECSTSLKDTSNRKKKFTKKSAKESDKLQIDIDHNCITCRSNFSSKNKLFEHLKKTGHGIYISATKNKDYKKNIK